MKKITFTLLTAAAACNVQAQNSGTITYQEKIKLEIVLDGADEKMLQGIPKERTSDKRLIFTPEASLYKGNDNSQPQEVNMETEGGGPVMIKMQAPEDQVYCDLKNRSIIEQRDFMSRKFLLESSFDLTKWKLTGNQKTILNYPCQEAILQDTAKKVTAWFTAAIPVSSGPDGYINLPGMVLAVDIDNGKRILTATNVELKEVDMALLTKPKEGKKTTKEEFSRIVEQKKKEMMEENGGRGNVIIKIKN